MNHFLNRSGRIAAKKCLPRLEITNHLSTLPKVKITHTNSNGESKDLGVPTIMSDETGLVDSLLSYTAGLVNPNASNIIAFSGGVDSSLVAALVYRTFHNSNLWDNKQIGSVRAVLGVSNSLPERQLNLAREVASSIGIDLSEVKTTEGNDETYIENKGQACFVCKSHLYAALEAVSQKAYELSNGDDKQNNVILYNGTNNDDTEDPTRLGLVAASNFSVRSPLINITKDEVRIASKHLGLPNHNYAASPCLRSRLALGVEATENHLKAVNLAEEKVRDVLNLDETMNLRVRMLAGQRAMVELDERLASRIQQAEDDLRRNDFETFCKELGFNGGIGLRPFKSGSVST